jgi:formamidopyrimidine-DNA glycosylase
VPELPEVEHVRRGLHRAVTGRRVARVDVGRERSVRRTGPEAVQAIVGARVTGTRRHGKYIVASFDNGHEAMIHLRMSGRVLIAAPRDPRPEHCHVTVTMSRTLVRPETQWRFVDPRTFGEFVVYPAAERDAVVPELARLGPDPLVDGLDAASLAGRLAGRRAAIKAMLLDQSVVAGIGNIYADEILHRARIRPTVPAAAIGPTRVSRLAEVIVAVLSEAVESGGSTLPDTQYVGVDGRVGTYQTRHRVYGRAGQICPTCAGARLSRTQVAGRTTTHCRLCQR